MMPRLAAAVAATTLCTLLHLAVGFTAEAAESSGERVEVSRDLWISAVESEADRNNGLSPRLKLKSIQEFFLIDFDPTPYAGRKVLGGELHLHLEGKDPMRRVTVSSVADEWVEGTGASYDLVPGASSFLWAETGKRRWTAGGKPCPDITGVVLGEGGSLWGMADATEPDERRWQSIAIDPAVLQARIDGRSHGFFVIDDVGSEYTREGNRFEYHLMPNRFFASRDMNRSVAPYFTIRFADTPGDRGRQPVQKETPEDADTHENQTAAASTPPKFSLPERVFVGSARGDAAVAAFDLVGLYGEPIPWNGLTAAKGEAVCFFAAAGVQVAGGDGVEVTLYEPLTVGGHIDPLVPGGDPRPPLASKERSDRVLVEVYIKKTAAAGEHMLKLSSGGERHELPLRVWNFTLPDRLSFLPQMNCYGLPGNELSYYRLAHEHRCVLNCLRYGWSGSIASEAAPDIGSGGEWDWAAFDKRFGPLFDGSAFAGLRRSGVPVDAFYLPINENWPMDHERHFRGGYWVENAYGEEYWAELREAARRFTSHVADRGWDQTMFEFYLNNKVYFKAQQGNRWDSVSAAWIFDEPANTQDFWALRRFGLEFWRGVEAAAEELTDKPKMTFRVDISRPEWQRELLDNVSNVEVVSGALRTYRDRVIERADEFDNLVYMYGSANAIGTDNAASTAWCVETWALGGDGVVPWQTIGKAKSWSEPDQLSLFYPAESGAVPSVRLKCFRAGQQMVEYLTLYCEAAGVDRAAVGAELLREYRLGGEMKKKSEDDAGDSAFAGDAAASLADLRYRLGEWLDAAAPPPVDRVFDPAPPLRDPDAVAEIVLVR